MNTGNFSQYIFQFTTGRILTVEEYGIFFSTNALIGILGSFIIGIVPLVISKILIESENSSIIIKKIFYSLLILSKIYFLIIIFITIFFSSYLMEYLNYQDNKLIPFASICSFFIFISVIFNGLIQGKRQYIKFAILASSPLIFKSVILVILYYYSDLKSYYLPLYSTLYGFLFAILIGLFFLKKDLDLKIEFVGSNVIIKFIKLMIPTFFTTIIIYLFSQLDIIMIKHLFSNYEVGIYSSCATFGKIIFFLAAILISVLYPESAFHNKNHEKNTKIIFSTLLITILLLIVIILIFYLYGSQIIVFTYGETYFSSEFSKIFLYLITINAGLLSIINVISFFKLATNSYSYIYVIALGLATYVITSNIFISDIYSILILQLIIQSSVLIIITLQEFLRFKAIKFMN